LFCSLNLLFGDAFVAIAVVVCLRSLMCRVLGQDTLLSQCLCTATGEFNDAGGGVERIEML